MENPRLTLCHRYSFISRSASEKKQGEGGKETERDGTSIPYLLLQMLGALSMSDVAYDAISLQCTWGV